MALEHLTFKAHGISVTIDTAVGHLAHLCVEAGGRTLRPLHRAPWIGAPEVPEEAAEGLKRLSGDFLCAPFSSSDVEPAPAHGWPANSAWDPISSERIDGGWRAHLRLRRRVMGACVDKILTLRDGHPFLYQEHVFEGGAGALSVAHHTMTALTGGGRLAFSPKRLAMTPSVALEADPARGRHMLSYPARTPRLSQFPRADGSFADLAEYPVGARNEDFVFLVEASHGGPGWTAVSRAAERDVVLVLKNPDELPVTMLWISNGGRDYPPWSGRHVGVLGIEDGRTALGHAASIGDNPLAREGVPTSFPLGGRVSLRQVIGALPSPRPGVAPHSMEARDATLRLWWKGESSSVPFDGSFLKR
jgi:hypothetical protein